MVELSIFVAGNSAGLLADSIHNLGDVSTTVAIWIAFVIWRRQPTARHPYGFHGAEDLAGLFVLLVMAVSGALAGYGSLQHLITGAHPTHLRLSAVAAVVGFAGNELVAAYKTHAGKRIGSVALQADGAHSRIDGLVSLAALAGIVGVALGFTRADGLAGVLITVVIAGVVVSSARGVLGRSLSSIDPTLTRQIHDLAASVPEVQGVADVRARWAGRALFVTLAIQLADDLPLRAAHRVAEQVRHTLLHEVENLLGVEVHMDPAFDRAGAHASTTHHLRPGDEQEAHAHDDGAHGQHGADGHAHEGGSHDGDNEPPPIVDAAPPRAALACAHD